MMNLKIILLLTAFFCNGINKFEDNQWIKTEYDGNCLYYKLSDSENKNDYNSIIVNGIHSVKSFFNSDFKREFDVYIHPDRHSLDSTWRKNWNMPDFRSECWMVGSGVADRLDLISPKAWKKEACEHDYSDLKHTRNLITHELVHVFHGQSNPSPDFTTAEGIDWFIEGLATYASGQCDSAVLVKVKKAIRENKIPLKLDDYWTGNLKYGLSGSMVMFIDAKFGRDKLIDLLPLEKKSEILQSLKTTEKDLTDNWKMFILNLKF
ncbi:MAG: hypothetical protein U0W24_12710 [Bacteroidales bacterium]